MIDTKALAALIAQVPKQADVYFADLAQVQAQPAAPSPEVVADKAPRDLAIDGVAYHVFNTLRGVDDTVDGATFEDVRAIVAEAF